MGRYIPGDRVPKQSDYVDKKMCALLTLVSCAPNQKFILLPLCSQRCFVGNMNGEREQGRGCYVAMMTFKG